jgi:hypothetical protein
MTSECNVSPASMMCPFPVWSSMGRLQMGCPAHAFNRASTHQPLPGARHQRTTLIVCSALQIPGQASPAASTCRGPDASSVVSGCWWHHDLNQTNLPPAACNASTYGNAKHPAPLHPSSSGSNTSRIPVALTDSNSGAGSPSCPSLSKQQRLKQPADTLHQSSPLTNHHCKLEARASLAARPSRAATMRRGQLIHRLSCIK